MPRAKSSNAQNGGSSRKSLPASAPSMKDPTQNNMYYKVQRDWTRNDKPSWEEGLQVTQEHAQGVSGAKSSSMLQRWQEETIHDQPYNNIEAVTKMDDGDEAGHMAPGQHQSSSVQYLDFNGQSCNGAEK